MSMKIALVGNPNSGKTSIFNQLTGSLQYVGNWPGVTVEKKEGKLRSNHSIHIIDLPGIYSLSPYSLEEVITRDYLLKEKPDVIIDVVDSTNIERNLYLTTQVLEMGIPTVIALNMADALEKAGRKISCDKLSLQLGCPVISTSALKNTGLEKLTDSAVESGKQKKSAHKPLKFSKETENFIQYIQKNLKDAGKASRWYAVKIFEKDDLAAKRMKTLQNFDIQPALKDYENKQGDDSASIIANERYFIVDNIIEKAMTMNSASFASTVSDKIDLVLTNRFLAIPIFLMIMWGMYYLAIQALGRYTVDITDYFFTDIIEETLKYLLVFAGTADWLQSLILDGIVSGVGSVLSFVPQLMILFFFISFLEDCGYMSRVAFIMDNVFRKFGLSGKSFIPMLIGTGCSVPGIMATRTIENQKDRRMTIMLTPFIPCGAKLPVFALMVSVFFPNHSFIGPSMYILGIIAVVISGLILKKTFLFKGKPAPFVMELPPYRLPKIKSVLRHVWERSKSFIIKAGTVIFLACILVWFMQHFDWSFRMTDTENSILASVGKALVPIFRPLGFGSWQSSIALLSGIFAKESIVSTFGVLYGNAGGTLQNSSALAGGLSSIFTPLSAYSFMAFTLLAAPCIAAMAVTRREMHSWKWTLIAIGYQTFTAYIVAMLIYQVGNLFYFAAV